MQPPKGWGHQSKKAAEENENDRIRDRSHQCIGTFALFVKRTSVYIEQEAKKFGFEHIEMDKKQFGCVTEEVVRSFGFSVGLYGMRLTAENVVHYQAKRVDLNSTSYDQTMCAEIVLQRVPAAVE